MTEVFESFCEKDTYDLAKRLGENATGNEVYALVGDLGAGKTAFAKGFAAGLGIEEPVVSPTFTLMQIYESGRLPLYHFDVYRIGDISEMDETGYDDYICSGGVTLVEWAQLVEPLIPEDAVHISIERDLSKDCDYRKITMERKTDEDHSN